MSCASGSIAIGEAFRQVRDGYADVMLAGGSEAPLTVLCFGAFSIIRAMSTRNDDPKTRLAPLRPRPRRLRDGRGRAVLALEERGPRAGARRAHLRRDLRASAPPTTRTT
jgi:3-oxoacyl-[acyl-carrier-protein] synthase II